MASPFPGMDPYLEAPDLWRGFHHHLAEELVRQLNPLVAPKYYADVDVHTVLQELTIARQHNIFPDVNVVEVRPQATLSRQVMVIPEAPLQRVIEIPEPIKLRTVNIMLTQTQELVTAIEILSPANKNGQGLGQYRLKRDRLLRSAVHLVEIDLLRGGQRPGPEVGDPPIDADYILLLNRASDGTRRVSEIWPIAVNEPLPVVAVPLHAPDPDIGLDLGLILQKIYGDNYYQHRINYRQPVPPPPLRPMIAEWLIEEELSR
jgi:hypothetical protein